MQLVCHCLNTSYAMALQQVCILSDDNSLSVNHFSKLSCMVQVTNNETGGQPPKLQSIVLFLRPYEYSHDQGTFVACPPMPLHIPRQICQALDDLYLIDQGAARAPASASALRHTYAG